MPADGMPMSAKRLSTSGGPEYVRIVYCKLTVWSGYNIWRNGPYIGGHLAFCFQIEFQTRL